MRAYSISPLDTWFFRDGRPYCMNESSQVDVKSLFPPSAYTLVGAMRASFARAMGWNGKSGDRWMSDITSILGDGRANLGKLRFHGPYIHSIKHGGLLLPAPLCLIGDDFNENKSCEICEDKRTSLKAWSFARLRPREAKDAVDCDLGDKVRLPFADAGIKGLEPLGEYYLTASDFRAVLSGSDLKDINPISRKALWDLEYWVGLKRNPLTLTTEDRALFSKYHVRLTSGVSLLMLLDGPDVLANLEPMLALGGESRMAIAHELDIGPEFLKTPQLKAEGDKVRFILTHLTPALLKGSWPGPKGQIDGVPGEIVSACLERPLFLGGWDSLQGKHGKPLSLQPYIPAGSTWFFEADAADKNAIELLHLSNIGEDVNYGFGQVAIGSW